MRHPAVPYQEHAVRAEAERLCVRYGLNCARDRFGNLVVRLATAPRLRPIVLGAHLDHPGFKIRRRLSRDKWVARFYGGVPEAYFRRGTRLRLWPGNVPARLGARVSAERDFEVHARGGTTATPSYAVWDLEDFVVRAGHVHGRACDNLVGVAAVLGTLIQLKRSRAKVHVLGLISRAEEIGFRGALAAAAGKEIPRDALVISLETSRELPGVRMGDGVIIRVGDRTSIFDSDATRFLSEVAQIMKRSRRGFGFQRALMSGGTCEGTAYQELGFQTGAVCVALGNYHNCGEANRIEAEYVSLGDACGMVDLLAATARHMPEYRVLTSRLPRQLSKLLREAEKQLRKTANDPD